MPKIYKEYTGTGAGGGNAGDGNNITSPRVGGEFFDDEEEMEHYTNKNIYGGEGGAAKKPLILAKTSTPNSKNIFSN